MSTSQVPPVDVAWKAWVPDLAAGLVVLAIGMFEVVTSHTITYLREDPRWIVMPTAVAVALSRRVPSAALVLVWLTCAAQVHGAYPFLFIQVALGIVAFGCARWGRPLTVLASGLSIPLAGLLAVRYVDSDMFAIVIGTARYQAIRDAVQQLGTTWQAGAALAGVALLGVPWLAGLVLRFNSRAAQSRASQRAAEQDAALAQRESEQAREIARLREEQTRLAHDVHDVVGHSLAVILAQAESAQFLDEADTGALRRSMENIASSARASLQDVRKVLSPTSAAGSGPGALADLVEGVRASGHDIRFATTGSERPLAPELATVAYRVLQEMLTNAIRHGARTTPLQVRLAWSEELDITVVNQVGDGLTESTGEIRGGQGLEGMRRRLASVGGRLVAGGDGTTYTATATVPLRTVYP